MNECRGRNPLVKERKESRLILRAPGPQPLPEQGQGLYGNPTPWALRQEVPELRAWGTELGFQLRPPSHVWVVRLSSLESPVLPLIICSYLRLSPRQAAVRMGGRGAAGGW